jgi:UDP-N-acetylmuramate--L-alanine ligase
LVVYSSAIPLNNPELTAASERGIPIVRRAVLLALLLQRQRGICVAGMHGKTTTAALLAFALEQLQSEPSYAVGALVPQLQPHARFRSVSRSGSSGTQPFFVIEADESDGTLCEFHPEHSIVLNVDEEHLDYFANLDAICREFRQFAAQTAGSFVFCADDARLPQIFASHPRAISYGYHPLSAYRIVPKAKGVSSMAENRCTSIFQPEPTAEFEIWRSGECLQLFQTRLLGEKNVSNTAAVIALLHQIGFHPEEIAQAIAPFRGAARRQQELFSDQRFRIFDDYGHHPSEIRATLSALKALGGRRLLVVFQPHRYTRTQSLLTQFASCFAEADRVWLTEVYAASEAKIPGVTGAALADAVRQQGQPVEFIPTLDQIPRAVRAAMQPGDVILFLGAGDITKAAHALAAELGKESPDQKERDFTELSGRLSPKSVLRRDEPLAKRTTLRVGGPADFYVEPASEAELAQVLQLCAERRLPFLLLGRGSNLLIRDGGIRGVVICLASAQFTRGSSGRSASTAKPRSTAGIPSRRKSHCHPASPPTPSSPSSHAPNGLPIAAEIGTAIRKHDSARARCAAGNHPLR